MKTLDVEEATVGYGKTYLKLREYARNPFLLNKAIIFASLTIDLSEQSYNDYVQLCAENGTMPKAKLIDSSVFNPVAGEIMRVLMSGFEGIIFTTHSSYMTILSMAKTLNITAVIDEVPSETIEYINVMFDDDTAPAIFNRWLVREACQHSKKEGVFIVNLKEEFRIDADDLARKIRCKKNTAYTEQVAVILESLLSNTVDVMYFTNADSEGTIYHKYQSIESQQLYNLVSSSHDITIMGANVLDTPFAYIAKALYGVKFREVSDYRKTHACKLVIYPYLKDGKWSRSLKRETVQEGLVGRFGDMPISMDIQHYADRLLKDGYLMCKNSKDTVAKTLQDKEIPCTTTHVHGINKYKELHKVAYIASSNPKPDETKTLALFAADNGLDTTELHRVIRVARNYEACRQVVGRCSVRQQTSEYDGIIRYAVVPDMEYAEYLKQSYPNAVVITDYSYSTTAVAEAEQRTEARAASRFDTIVAILTAKKNKEGPMPVLWKKFGISKPTFDNYKKEYRKQLVDLGLLKK